MGPIDVEFYSFLRNCQVTLFLAKNIDPNAISLRTNGPAYVC